MVKKKKLKAAQATELYYQTSIRLCDWEWEWTYEIMGLEVGVRVIF